MRGGGCSCGAYLLAVAAGIFLGLVGLGLAAYFSLSAKLIDPAPAAFSPRRWTAADEAALAVKLAPIALALKRHESRLFSLQLSPGEANRLFQEHLPADWGPDWTGEIQAGDTAWSITFCRRLTAGKYVNGELRAEIRGADGDFEVQVYHLRTGRFVWPRPLLPEVSEWLEGILETQKLFLHKPWRLRALSASSRSCTVEIRTQPPWPTN